MTVASWSLADAVPQNSRLRSKGSLFALLAGLLVLSFVLYSREGYFLPTTESSQSLKTGEQAIETPTQISPGKSEAATVTATLATEATPASPSIHQLPPGAPRAVIIETSIISTLIPIILHFSNVLSPIWGITLFTLEETWIEPSSAVFQRALKSGRIEVRFLPSDAELTSSHGVSVFLTSPWIWEQLELAERVLLFQADSILCSKSQDLVENYLEYDYAGAPIASQYGQGYNGGLSIRNPRLFLEIVKETDFLTSGQSFEDQFFYGKLKEKNAKMPTEDIAKRFSVETIYYETPLGYHQPQRWQAKNMDAIEAWCPEVKMLIGRRAT